ncbi:MAG: DNA polymerase III subunit gamma/tau [Herminiimonas sp.]|nr:DNA polymerase III subunit gamma/tau [Herminiimonas sp.]
MSYQVLARKYRPKGFDTLVGQDHVVRALSHALDSGRLHHAYLFTGTRGVGKTTLSRILAKAFNCQGADGKGGVTSQPCGVCDACVAIDGGRFVDYIEIDAASNRGVDEMAQLLEQAVYAPSNARFKVYMIDEVHMLTNHAFNAMLKTLEEPPSHVKFILATTDPQKIPATVLSRCLQFNLKQMPPAQIVSHLTDILGQEAIAFETPALRLLAQGAHGSMRDALSLTDQAIAYAAGNVTLEAVQGMLGALDQSFLVRILDALAIKDGAGLITVADEMAVRSLSYNAALQDIGSLLHRIALAQTVPAAIADDLPERAQILRLADLFDADEIQLFYQIAVHGRNELGLAPDDYTGFSMTLLRMLAFRPGMGGADGGGGGATQMAPRKAATTAAAPVITAFGASASAANAAVPVDEDAFDAALHGATASAGAQKPSPGRASAALAAAAPIAKTMVAAPPAASAMAPSRADGAISPARAALNAARSGMKVAAPPAAPVVSAPAALPDAARRQPAVHADEAPIELAPAPPWDDGFDSPGSKMADRVPAFESPCAAEIRTAPALSAAALTSAAMPASAPLAPAVPVPVAALGWDGDWPKLAAVLPVRGVVQQLAQQSELLKSEQLGDVTCLRLQVAVETLRAAATVEKLAAALTAHFSKPVRIETQAGAVQYSANAALLAERAERQRQAEVTMQGDPFVQSLMREFGATIVPGSIKPVSLN